jgi:hypothetical protein
MEFPSMLANTITPSMLLGCWQLVFGNAIIGLVEARVIVRFFAPGRRAPNWTMIGANYFSMIVGFFLVDILGSLLAFILLGAVPLDHIRRLIVGLILLHLVVSIVLEWPFVHGVMGPEQPHRARRSLIACAAANAASYILLLVPFWLSSNVLSGVQRVSLGEILRNKDAAVLYIADDGDVYRVGLDGSPPAKFRSLACRDTQSVLSGCPDRDGRLGLWLGDYYEYRRKLVDDSPALMAQLRGYGGIDGEYGRYRSAVDLRARPGDPEGWSAHTLDSLYGGLDAWKGSPLGDRVRVAVSTPVFSWHSRCAAILPNDQVVFELNNHILLVDLDTRRVALVAMGRGPVVLLPPTPGSAATVPSTESKD